MYKRNENEHIILEILIFHLSAWGIYATGSSKFSVNLMMENGEDFMIHVDFRSPPSENKVRYYLETGYFNR